MSPDPTTLTTDQLRAETRRLIELSRKVNSQASFLARALKRRLKDERLAAASDTPQQGE